MKTKIEYAVERWGRWGKQMRRRKWCEFDRSASLARARRFAGWDRKENGYVTRVVKITTIIKRRVLSERKH